MSAGEKAAIHVAAAQGALEERDPIGALAHIAEAEKLNKDMPELYHVRALAFHQRKMSVEALIAARKAVELAPLFSAANNTLGKLLMDEGRFDEALVYLQKAATDTLYRDAFKAHTAIGIINYKRNRYDLALQGFDRAIQDAPATSCVAHFYKGQVQLARSDYSGAIGSFEKATMRVCSQYAEAHLALGLALERGDLVTRAKKKYLDISKVFPNSKIAEQAMERLRGLP